MKFFTGGRMRLLLNVYLVFILLPGGKIASQPADAAARAKAQAQLMIGALLKSDWKVFAHYANPAVLNMIGGPQGMEQMMTQVSSNMKTQGLSFNKVTVGEPGKIVKAGTELQSTIPQITEIRTRNGVAVVKTTLIAISQDGGKNWTFLDTVNKEADDMRKIWPNLSQEIIIPPTVKEMKKE
jgi:hypothetical protein